MTATHDHRRPCRRCGHDDAAARTARIKAALPEAWAEIEDILAGSYEARIADLEAEVARLRRAVQVSDEQPAAGRHGEGA